MPDSLGWTRAIDPERGTQSQQEHNSPRHKAGYNSVNFWLWENEKIRNGPVSGWPTIWELALRWFAFQRLANREQEDGTLVFCVR
jgi:hypothetical protein